MPDPMQTEHAQNIYGAASEDGLRSFNFLKAVWYESECHKKTSFAGMLHVYPDKIATTIEVNAIVA